MKGKLIYLVLCIVILVSLATPAFAAGSSGSFTGPEVIRSWDVITLTFSLSGNGIYGVTGTLEYNTRYLEPVSGPTQVIGAPWIVEFSGNQMVAYDNNMSNPIHAQTAIFTVQFRVKALPAGTKMQVSMVNLKVSDGKADEDMPPISYTATVSPPRSDNNQLSSMEVTNATVTPAFSPATVSYTAQVPYEVTALNIQATAAHSGAVISVNSPELTPNEKTPVTVTVTAENGATRTYTITVFREQDPNYVPSGENRLQILGQRASCCRRYSTRQGRIM